VWCSTTNKENLGGLAHALWYMQKALLPRSKEQFGAVSGDLKVLQEQLEEVKSRAVVCQANVRAITARMDELLYREEMMWLQRSCVVWFKEADRNTGFFHHQARWRARKNKISKLKRADGLWTEDPKEMKELSVAFFADLYKVDNLVNPHQVLPLVEAECFTGNECGPDQGIYR
jgi:hypothetical protein